MTMPVYTPTARLGEVPKPPCSRLFVLSPDPAPETIANAMAPYRSNTDGTVAEEYLTFESCAPKAREMYDKIVARHADMCMQTELSTEPHPYLDMDLKALAAFGVFHPTVKLLSFEEFIQHPLFDKWRDPKSGDLGSWLNLKGTWNDYTIATGPSQWLWKEETDPKHPNQAQLRDLDLRVMLEHKRGIASAVWDTTDYRLQHLDAGYFSLEGLVFAINSSAAGDNSPPHRIFRSVCGPHGYDILPHTSKVAYLASVTDPLPNGAYLKTYPHPVWCRNYREMVTEFPTFDDLPEETWITLVEYC